MADRYPHAVNHQSLFAAALWAIATVACAQNWPAGKPVRLVVAYPPGGVSDSVGRALAERLAIQLATPVLVENKAGASGSIGIEAVAGF